MRRLIIGLMVPGLMFAALPAGVNWELRTTGNDVNGGGFVAGASGTDFSQQNAAQQAYTDLVIGGTTTQLTSIAHPFGATAVGNIINITGGTGCTTGRYQVVSVVTVTATMDRSVGTAASTCTGNLGGGLATFATAITSLVTGNTVWVQAGTYTQTVVQTITHPSVWEGYQTTHGDFGTPPLITTATNSTVLIQLSTTTVAQMAVGFINMNFSNTAATRAAGFQGTNTSQIQLQMNGCVLDGFSPGINNANQLIFNVTLVNVEIKNTTILAGIVWRLAGVLSCHGCWIHNSVGAGIEIGSSNANIDIVNSIFSANGQSGVSGNLGGVAYKLTFVNSVSANNTGSGIIDGYATDVSTFATVISNSIIYGNTLFGVDTGATANPVSISGKNNAYGANNSGNFTANMLFPGSPGDITLTASPFTSATDFSLNSTAGGGVLLKALGWPGIFPGGLTTGVSNVGPVQGSGAPAATGSVSGYVGELRRTHPQFPPWMWTDRED